MFFSFFKGFLGCHLAALIIRVGYWDLLPAAFLRKVYTGALLLSIQTLIVHRGISGSAHVQSLKKEAKQ